LEAALRLLRRAWRDTVRSLTGDKGVQYVKEEIAARLADSRGELKEAAKVAIQKSREAVKENIIDDRGREALKREVQARGKVGIRRHWRLGVVIVIVWGLLAGAGKACHMACSESGAPAPQVAPNVPDDKAQKVRGAKAPTEKGG